MFVNSVLLHERLPFPLQSFVPGSEPHWPGPQSQVHTQQAQQQSGQVALAR
jgi:hypothetical protein